MRRLRVQNVDGRHSLTGTRLEIKPAAPAASWRREGLKESHHAWKGQTRAKGTRGATACELSDRTGETNPPFQHPLHIGSVTFSSVAQSCPTLCDPIDCSTPGLPVHHQLPEFTQTHVHRVGDAIQPSHPRSSPSPPAPNPSQHQSLFQ